MKSILLTAAAVVMALQATMAMAADAKACKEGQVYNPQTGKCVTKRGS